MRPAKLRPVRRRRSLLLLLLGRPFVNSDCSQPATATELRTRPWFCRDSDLKACLSYGHEHNRTGLSGNPGLCQGRWAWYQLRTVHDHNNVAYYEISSAEDGALTYVRRTKTVRDVKHAVALHVQTAYCPHTPDCGASGEPDEYYTTVDVLVVDGDPLHAWNSEAPFTGDVEDDLRNYYTGERFGRGYRYFTDRKSVSMSLGFHMNGTANCAPELQEKVNIGIRCAWSPDEKREPTLAGKPCYYSVKVRARVSLLRPSCLRRPPLGAHLPHRFPPLPTPMTPR